LLEATIELQDTILANPQPIVEQNVNVEEFDVEGSDSDRQRSRKRRTGFFDRSKTRKQKKEKTRGFLETKEWFFGNQPPPEDVTQNVVEIYKPEIDPDEKEGMIPEKAIFTWELENYGDEELKWLEIYHPHRKLWPDPEENDLKYHVLFYYFPRDPEEDIEVETERFKKIVKTKKFINPTSGKLVYVPWLVETARRQKFPKKYPDSSRVRIIDDNDDASDLLLLRSGKHGQVNKEKQKIKLYQDLIFDKHAFEQSSFGSSKKKKKKKAPPPKRVKRFDCAKEIKKLWTDGNKTVDQIKAELGSKCNLGKSRLQENNEKLQAAIKSGIGKLRGVWSRFWGYNNTLARKLLSDEEILSVHKLLGDAN